MAARLELRVRTGAMLSCLAACHLNSQEMRKRAWRVEIGSVDQTPETDGLSGERCIAVTRMPMLPNHSGRWAFRRDSPAFCHPLDHQAPLTVWAERQFRWAFQEAFLCVQLTGRGVLSWEYTYSRQSSVYAAEKSCLFRDNSPD